MRFLGVIPARGGSKGVPGKNIRQLAGKPLIAWTIDAAKASGAINRLVVSTDDNSIADVARKFGAEVRLRPSILAADDTPTRPVLEHVARELESEGAAFDAVVTLQPTSPLRLPRHISEACDLFAADPHADSLVSCVAVPHIFNPVSVMKKNAQGYLESFLVGDTITRRQDKPQAFARNGAAVYVTRRDRIGDYVFGGKLLCYLMEEKYSLDIDTLEDFAAARSSRGGLVIMLRELRRKFLLGLDLLDWRRQTALLRAEIPPPPDKILLVGSLLTIPATLKAEAVYARALQIRGYRPVFALKDASAYNVRLLKTLLGQDLRIVTPGDYTRAEDEADTRDRAASLLAANATVADFVALEVGGIRVGRNSLSTVVRSLRASHVDFADPDHRARIEAALAQSLLAARQAARLVAEVEPDAALFNERGYTPSGELFDACLLAGANTVQWLGAPQADHLLYKRYTMATRGQHPLALSDQTWAALSAAPWSPADEDRLMAKLASHYESGTWFNRQQLQTDKQVIAPGEVRRALGVGPNRKIAVIFSHILYDATFFYGDSLYPDYASWLVETVRAAIANPEIHWVVKVHPVNVWRSKMDDAPLEQLEARLLRDAFGELPPHVTIMPADTEVNTYALFPTIDYGLTVRGTVGMELPCYGIPTVTAGTGRYSGRGFTMEPATPADYQALLARLHTVPRLDAQTVTVARRYAYGTFFLRPARMDSARLLFNHPSSLPDFTTHFRIYLRDSLDQAKDLRDFSDFASGEGADFLNTELK